MSSKYFVDDIEKATRAYDRLTKQYVLLEERASDNFWICQPYETDEYILCNQDNLTELHYM